jgi:predicted amidohydrolase YtcJ
VTNHSNYKKYGPQPLPFDEQVIGVKRTCEEYLRWGVTAFRAAEDNMGSSMKIFHEAKLRGYLKIRLLEILHGIYFSPEDHSAKFIKKDLSKMYVVRNLEDRYLRWRGTKYYSDGGCGTRSAWLSEPFYNPSKFGEKEPNCGNPVTSDYERRKDTYIASVEQGFDLNTHCCGDQAMRFTTDLYIELMRAIKNGEYPIWKGRKEAKDKDWDFRWAIEHAYLPLESRTYLIEDMSTYNIMAHVQPIFGWQEGISFRENLGPERMARWAPMRSYIEHGVICPNSSDYPVTTHNPWMGIYFMLTREIQAQDPKSFGTEKDEYKDETVGISDALISSCAMGPYSTFAEDWKGSIKKGHVADLVILDIEDIFDLERNPKLLWEMEKKIVATLVDGEIRYQRNLIY